MSAGSTFGKNFKVTTFGESHGKGLGCVIDGCPAGLPLEESDLVPYLDRRKPGQSQFTTKRNESDSPEILSGVFEGVTTGTPIAILIRNTDQRSGDYGEIAKTYRPGHADYTFDKKFGIRDYRGGGRSSGRETAARVAAGAVAAKLLDRFDIKAKAYTKSIGSVTISNYDADEINSLYMPDRNAYEKASEYIQSLMEKGDSAGGIIECVIKGVPAGLGDPVFDKLDAMLAYGMMSIGAVKGVEIGDGFDVSHTTGSQNNDSFLTASDGKSIIKASNHSGGILGGISDGSDIILRCAIKPTPSISIPQHTADKDGNEKELIIKGRHDPVIVPRAVVVVESMANIVIADAMISHLGDKVDHID